MPHRFIFPFSMFFAVYTKSCDRLPKKNKTHQAQPPSISAWSIARRPLTPASCNGNHIIKANKSMAQIMIKKAQDLSRCPLLCRGIHATYRRWRAGTADALRGTPQLGAISNRRAWAGVQDVADVGFVGMAGFHALESRASGLLAQMRAITATIYAVRLRRRIRSIEKQEPKKSPHTSRRTWRAVGAAAMRA